MPIGVSRGQCNRRLAEQPLGIRTFSLGSQTLAFSDFRRHFEPLILVQRYTR